jgi:hypothetical protein
VLRPFYHADEEMEDQVVNKELKLFQNKEGAFAKKNLLGLIKTLINVDVSYTTLQAHGIVNVALDREYTPGIVFIFS